MTQKTNGNGAKVATAQKEKVSNEKEVALNPLETQLAYFVGLEKLVNVRRRFEAQKEVIEKLTFVDEDLAKFELDDDHYVRIELVDSERNKYAIANPRLVKELQQHLVTLLNAKIAEYDTKILEYAN